MTLAELHEAYEKACRRVQETAAAVEGLPATATLEQIRRAGEANAEACADADGVLAAVERREAIERGRAVHGSPRADRPGGFAGGESPIGRALADGLEDVRSGRVAVAYVDPSTGQRTDAEQRALVETGASGALVPVQMGETFFTLRASSVVLGLPGIHLVPMTSDRVRFPRVAGVDASGSDIAAAGVLENAAIGETTPDVDAVDLVACKFGVYHVLSSELVEDSSPDALALFGQNMLTQLGLKVDFGMLEGSGASQLVGLRNQPGISTTSVAGLPADFDKLSDTVYAAEAANANPSVWVMHPRSWNTLSKIKTGLSGDKTTLLEPDPEITATTLLGLTVHKSTQITLVEGAGAGSWVAAVDPRQIIVGVRRAPLLELSRDVSFQSDAIALRATARYAFGLINPAGVSIATDVRAS